MRALPEVANDSAVLDASLGQETAPSQATLATSDTTNPVRAAAPSVLPGYQILGELGRGSMGVVYKARQKGLDRHVALKMILADLHASQDQLHRFTTEARVLASLQHPNIVQIYDINLQHDHPYFSMELVDGGTLADRLGGRPQPFRAAAQLVLTLARTMHVAHQHGIVHRDLKPGNVLLASAESRSSSARMALEMELHPQDLCLGTPKITDFGLAKELHADAGQTESGIILGTPSYMAPEQAEGKSHEVGPAADVYALGAILYETLTGRPPFTADSRMETLLLLFHADPVSPCQLQPKIPRDLETICLKCLHKEPYRRYASAEELANDLHRFLVGEAILARPASLYTKVGKWARRRPTLATLAGCAVMGAVSTVGLILWHQVELQSRLQQALQDERETRSAHEAASERERLGQIREKVKDLVHAGEEALIAQDWQQAQGQLARASDLVAGEPELADLHTHVQELQQQTNQQRVDRQRLEKFRQRRNEALYHATLFTGSNVCSALEDTRVAARDALTQFGITEGSTAPAALGSPVYTEREKADVVEGCYELLAVLADAMATPALGRQGADERAQAEEALRILDRTTGLGVMTQAYHRRRAHYLAQAGQKDAAEQERLQANAVRPSTPLDHFLLGQEHYHRGDCKQAIVAFENALQLRPDHFWARYYLGLSWLKTERPNLAVTCLTSCLAQHRDFPWLYLLRASAWSELGQFDRAEADFETALHAPLPEGARYGLLINRGVMRIRQGHVDSACADLQQAIALRPQQYQGYLNLAQAYLKDGQWNKAVEQLNRAIRLEPGLASLYRTRARLWLQRQDQKAALVDLDQAIRLGSNQPAVAEDRLEVGRLLCMQKDFSGALKACDAVLGQRPHDLRAYHVRAEALLGLKRLPEALQALDDCLKYGPADAGALRTRAALRTQLGQYAGAQTDYTRALELEPDAATYAARGWCYAVADAPKLALPDFEEAIRLDPKPGDAYAGRGLCRILLGNYRLAVLDAEEALRRGPASPHLCYNVARIYAQAVGRLDREPLHVRRDAEALLGVWQQRALDALAKTCDLQPPAEAASYWNNIVATDKALLPIRQGPGFNRLADRYSLRRAAMAP
jgi:tetratricopeptide (TPR) repeat protein/tRNA A-37 threonylcarbamoyl transferase component Bud32